VEALDWKILLFLSFHKVHEVAHQIKVTRDLFDFKNLAKVSNWRKWSDTFPIWAIWKPIHPKMSLHKEPTREHRVKRCSADFGWSQPTTHIWASSWRIPRLYKLVFAGNLLRRSRKTNIDTFKGITWLRITHGAIATW